MTQAIAIIVKRFGGARAMSRALGKENNSTVQYWAKNGFLPRSARESVLGALCTAGMAPKQAQRLVDQAVLGKDVEQPETVE